MTRIEHVVAAVDQHVTDAGFAHLAEGDLLRGSRHAPVIVASVNSSFGCLGFVMR